MNRTQTILLFLALTFVSFAKEKRPNILFIYTDDHQPKRPGSLVSTGLVGFNNRRIGTLKYNGFGKQVASLYKK